MNGMDQSGGWDRGNVVGVLGGLGPLAAAQFLETVVNRTVAGRDQDHIDMIVSQHSTTPDRTAFLFDDQQPSPVPAMVHDAKMLESAGADFLVLTCNTGHAFTEQIEAATSLEMLGILETTVDEVARRSKGGARVALLATDGTRKARLYQDELEARGFEVLLPDSDDQALVMDLIYNQVKAGKTDRLGELRGVIERLGDEGADYFVMGCTELSVAAKKLGILDDPEIVDSLQSLADATIRRAGHRVKER